MLSPARLSYRVIKYEANIENKEFNACFVFISQGAGIQDDQG